MKCLLFAISLIAIYPVKGQPIANSSNWVAAIHRPDSNDIAFTFSVRKKNNKTVLYIKNGRENLKVDSVRFTGDSVFIKMPLFESVLRARVTNDQWQGIWIKSTSAQEQVLPFSAKPGTKRFSSDHGKSGYNISGRWSVTFAKAKPEEGKSVGEFIQVGNVLYGTFLTPSGDYRFQEGIVTGNKLKLSGFDGSHAYSFTAEIKDDKTITNGMYYSGAKYKEAWFAVKDPNARVNTNAVAMHLRPGEDRLNFKFPDLDGKEISINDNRFKHKVVIIQLMGSWCPNCMDETKFLSNYYNNNKHRGLEILALAYEYSTDFNRSVKSINKFKEQFGVKYPMLITGVKVSDSLRTEKTLPQVTPIKVFPTSIFIDKNGVVRKFDTGFFGPGTGSHFEEYKKEFYKTMEELLNEK
jgi:thiol-disulfide isomerase/thioredoxin